MAEVLKAEGKSVNRKCVQRLMRLMDIESCAPKPNTSRPAPEHTKFPYLLRNLKIERVDQVWASDITYIPLAEGFANLVAILDLYSRRVLINVDDRTWGRFCVVAIRTRVVMLVVGWSV